MDEEEPKPKRCRNPNCAQPDKTTADFQKKRRNKDGLDSWCKQCRSGYRKLQYSHGGYEQAMRWRKANPLRPVEIHRKHRYGISVEDQRKLWKVQMGKCFLCGDDLDYIKANLDHDHVTGRVRGFLCWECNHAVGLLRENPKLMRRAAAYVQAFQSSHPDPLQLLLGLRSIGGF